MGKMKECYLCGEPAELTLYGKPVCEPCGDAETDWGHDDGPDPHGDRDPTPEQQAGWAMQDKIDMYRNEY